LNVKQDTQPAAYEAYIRGRGYLQELKKPEDLDAAIEAFTQVLKIDPKYALGYAALGDAYLDGYLQFGKGNDWMAKASSYCEKALFLNPVLAAGHICLGKVFNNTGKYDKAVEEFQRAVKSEPSNEDALRGFAAAYTNLGNFAAAEATYKQAIALRPNYWRPYSWLGVSYFTQAKYSDAAEMFRKVTELAPDNYLGYSNLGGAYVLLGRYQDAISALERSIALRPSSEAYANLGYTYFLMHRFSDAVTALEAVKPEEREWQNWGNLADALYWSPGRRAEATHTYQTAISLALPKLEVNPKDPSVLVYLANYYAMIEDRRSSFSYLHRTLEETPSDPEVLFRAGLVYNHFNQTEQALSFLKKAAQAHYSRTVIRDTPDFQSLQKNAEFQELIRNN
jgi:tetratricopeptide (TPR) repeat protein